MMKNLDEAPTKSPYLRGSPSMNRETSAILIMIHEQYELQDLGFMVRIEK
jgi:hypothetical protein